MQEAELQNITLLPLEQQIAALGSPSRAISYRAYIALMQQGSVVLDAAIRGLKHRNSDVRRWCADLMDHLGDERCVVSLVQATADPVAKVRRQAVHSLSCQRCKAVPLHGDITTLLIERATSDPSIKVRCEAVFGLSMQPSSTEAIDMLETLMQTLIAKQPLEKVERVLLRNARYARKRQRQDQHSKSGPNAIHQQRKEHAFL